MDDDNDKRKNQPYTFDFAAFAPTAPYEFIIINNIGMKNMI